jgi:O-antigen ligase
LLTIIVLPRRPGEGTKLERTSSIFAKVENYQEGYKLFTQSPIIGHGYNNLPLIRNSNATSHANSGFVGSLLTILTTTGLIGFFLFSIGIGTYYHQSDLLKKTMLISLLVHSLFANSLLYPWILLSFVLF